ncbi:MAG: hypothetical protein Q7J98_07345 [Kiritimatiellia bacterium]|nr:hypothetical protein [Kiritimatiellia bacterium]
MELEFKQDFDETRKNWGLFWEGKLNRPIILAITPKPGKEPVSCPKWGEAFCHNHEDVVDQALRWAESHEFLCDAVPFFTPSLMTGFFSAILGAEVMEVREAWGVDTAVVPFVKDLGNVNLKFRRDSKWWEKWVALCECFKRKCAGRLVFGEASLGGNLDTLGAIRGTAELMMDFYDNPAGVHNAMRQILEAYNQVMDEYIRIFEFKKHGGVTRHGFYADGIIGVPQCDFGFSIGKEHFDEFARPYLKKEIERLDAVEYHLDGPGSIVHAESICSIDKIGVVQWVAGAGNEQKDWTWLYEKINALGKGLWLWASSPEHAVSLWKKYANSGRMILSVRAETREEALRYLTAFEEIR